VAGDSAQPIRLFEMPGVDEREPIRRPPKCTARDLGGRRVQKIRMSYCEIVPAMVGGKGL